jgi:phosphotransferase system HPr (HPr) family protein
MKHSKVVVPWQEGLHLRQALTLVKIGKFFRSSIVLRSGHKLADLRSIISIIALCASMGTALDVEVCGDDEADATRAIEKAFSTHHPQMSANDNLRQG